MDVELCDFTGIRHLMNFLLRLLRLPTQKKMPPPPPLISVIGATGTGKSQVFSAAFLLAAALSPLFLASPANRDILAPLPDG